MKNGDIVQLNSGGPRMTVSKVYTSVSGDKNVTCIYVSDKGTETLTVPEVCVKIYGK